MSNVTIPSGIRGVSEERRTPRLGKIRLGIQVPNKAGNGTHPEMSPYFVFDGDTAAGAALYEMFGEECNEIPVAFPSDDPSEFARRNLEMWGAGTLKCKGNGVQALALVDPKEYAKHTKAVEAAGGERTLPDVKVWASTSRAGNANRDNVEPVREVIPCFGLGYDGEPACPKFATGKDCKATMHLQVVVRGFPGLGIFQVDTGSVVNIGRIDDFLAYLGNFTGGRYAFVPLLMRLEPYEMRGRKFYGLQFAVDFAAMQAEGIGALPAAGQMSITDRVVAYLPQESARPVAAQLLSPAVVDDESPDDVGVLTGDLVEPEDEMPDDAGYADEIDGDGGSVPIDPEVLREASAWVDSVAAENNVTRERVLERWQTDIFGVAAHLAGFQERYAQRQARRAAKAGAAS